MHFQLDQLPIDLQKWFCDATKNPPPVIVITPRRLDTRSPTP